MADACPICALIPRFTGDNPHFVAELDSGYAVLGDSQMYRGYTLFIAKRCVPELHELPTGERSRFLQDMALVAEAVFRAFSPRKLNYELLGNSVTHLHWHLFPRHADDPNPQWPVWSNPAFIDEPRDRPAIPREQLDDLRPRLRAALVDVSKRP